MMQLDTISWRRTLDHVHRSLRYAASPSAQSDRELYEEFRTSTIQRFEVAWELSVKFLRRGLKSFRSQHEIDDLSYRDLVRVGAECGLVQDPAAWYDFRALRNLTSHTYDEEKAQQVFDMAPEFLKQAEFLYARISGKEN